MFRIFVRKHDLLFYLHKAFLSKSMGVTVSVEISAYGSLRYEIKNCSCTFAVDRIETEIYVT